MESKLFCQSCTMPIDNIIDRGTEVDESTNDEYCKYCYQHGRFTRPVITINQMRSIVNNLLHNKKLPEEVIQRSLNILPNLKRWAS